MAISNSTIGECCSRLWLRCKGAYSFENFIFACAIQIIRESFHFVDGRLRWLALAQPWLQFIVEEFLIKLSQLAVVAASSSLCAVLLRVLRCREATRHYCDISLSAIYAAIVYVYFGLCGKGLVEPFVQMVSMVFQRVTGGELCFRVARISHTDKVWSQASSGFRQFRNDVTPKIRRGGVAV